MHAAIRQGKAKAGMAEELARRIKGRSQTNARLRGSSRILRPCLPGQPQRWPGPWSCTPWHSERRIGEVHVASRSNTALNPSVSWTERLRQIRRRPAKRRPAGVINACPDRRGDRVNPRSRLWVDAVEKGLVKTGEQ
jgi:hypothetical protein